MRKKYRPEAYIYEDGTGIFTISCSTKEIAQKAMIETIRDHMLGGYDMGDFFRTPEDVKIDIDLIKENRIYKHRGCDQYSIGDSTCYDCGETIENAVGRRTFTYLFEL